MNASAEPKTTAKVTSTAEMRAEVKRLLPPSVRDREIFERVAGEREGQAEVGRDWNLSQARVSQIVEQVRTWLAAATDQEAGDLPPHMQLRLGARMVRLRLECLLTQSMRGWRASQGLLTTTHERAGGNGDSVDRVTRPSFGDVKYLTAYRHVALALARLDGVVLAPKIAAEPQSEEEVLAALLAVIQANASEQARESTSDASGAIEISEQDLVEHDLCLPPVVEPQSAVDTAVEPSVTVEPALACGASAEPNSALPPAASAAKTAYKKARTHRQKRRARARERQNFLQSNVVSSPVMKISLPEPAHTADRAGALALPT